MHIHLQSLVDPTLPRCLQFGKQWLQDRWRANPQAKRKMRVGRWGVTCKRCLKYPDSEGRIMGEVEIGNCVHCGKPLWDNGTVAIHLNLAIYEGKPIVIQTQWCDALKRTIGEPSFGNSDIWPCEHCAELDPDYVKKGPPK
jgi:hypothetical protein